MDYQSDVTVPQHTNKYEYFHATLSHLRSPSYTVSMRQQEQIYFLQQKPPRDYIVMDKTSSKVRVHSTKASSSSCSASRSLGESSSNGTSSDGYVVMNDGGAIVMGPAGEPASMFLLFPGSRVPKKPCNLVISTRHCKWEVLNCPHTFRRTRI